MLNINIHEVVRVEWDKAMSPTSHVKVLIIHTQRDVHCISLFKQEAPDDKQFEDTPPRAA